LANLNKKLQAFLRYDQSIIPIDVHKHMLLEYNSQKLLSISNGFGVQLTETGL